MKPVTAIITNYNQGKFFQTALDSIIKQTYSPEQLIVVDDCSTDDSRKIISRSLEDTKGLPPIINTVFRDTNGKPAGARNSGIKEAIGDIIAFLDVDDFYYPTKIEESVKLLEEDPIIGLVYSDYDVYDTIKNKHLREFKHPYNYQLLWQTCIVSTNSIIKKEVFDKVGLFDERFFGTEDYNLWLRIARHYMIRHIPKPLFCYRLHGQNITMTRAQEMAQEIQVWKRELLNAKHP